MITKDEMSDLLLHTWIKSIIDLAEVRLPELLRQFEAAVQQPPISHSNVAVVAKWGLRLEQLAHDIEALVLFISDQQDIKGENQ